MKGGFPMLTIRETLRMTCLAVAGITVAYCSNDEFEGNAPKGQTIITAGFEQPGAKTRTSVGSSNEVLWMSGDAFRLFYTESTTAKTADFSTTQDQVAQATFTTSPELAEEISSSYAVYPAGYNPSLGSDDVVTMTLPKSFTSNSGHSDGPMYADASAGYNNLQFKHLCGLLKLTVTELPTTAKQFVISAEQNLAGKATATLSDEEPVLAITDDSEASKNITVSINVAAETTTQTFYIPIPVGNYTNLKAEIKGDGGSTIATHKAKVWPYVTVTRANMLYATFGFDLETSASVGSGSISAAIQEAAPKQDLSTQTSTTVLITGNLDVSQESNATIEVPVKTNSDIALTFEKVPTNTSTTPLTIKEADVATGTVSAEESKNVLTLSIPKTESSNQPSLVINTPNSTTELTTTGSAATFAEVTALTANNTLVINQGVTITNLKVKGGNIRIKSGATVSTLTKEWSGDNTVTVYVEEGASCPNPLPTGFVSKSTDLENVFENGGEVTLSSNVELTKVLVVNDGKDVTLDLNGFSITPKSNTVLTAESGCYNSALIVVRRGGKLTINDSSNGKGQLNTKNEIKPGTTQPYVYAGILLVDYNEDKTATDKKATLVINGGSFKAPWYTISGNGTQHGTDVTINGGQFVSIEGPGIYHPQEGSLTITGGEISGAECAIELRSGTLNISGGTFTSTADPATVEPNGSGTTTAGAALAVVQHTTKKDINVTISGGTFNGVYSLFQKDIQNNNTDNVTMSVTGGNFNGEVYSQNCTTFVKGGTFSDPSVVTNYLAENANVKVVLHKNYTGPGFGLYNEKNSGYGKGATIDVDLNNFTWNVADTPLFGSTGYESQYFHLEKETTVTFKNGTIQPKDNGGKMMIQNYCNLTLENVSVFGGTNCSYVVSNNNGKCDINNSTITAKGDNCAFDVYSFNKYEGVTVTITGSSVINGKVEFGGNNNKQNGTLIVNGGTLNGNLVVTEDYVKEDKSNLQVNGGTWGDYSGWSNYTTSSYPPSNK